MKDILFLVVHCTSKYKVDTVECNRRISKRKTTTLLLQKYIIGAVAQCPIHYLLFVYLDLYQYSSVQ